MRGQREDRLYFIGPFGLPLGVQQEAFQQLKDWICRSPVLHPLIPAGKQGYMLIQVLQGHKKLLPSSIKPTKKTTGYLLIMHHKHGQPLQQITPKWKKKVMTFFQGWT